MNRRFGEILLGLFLLMVGISALASNTGLAMILVAIGLIIFAVQYGRSANQIPPRGVRRRDYRRRRAWWEELRDEFMNEFADRQQREAEDRASRIAQEREYEARQARLQREERPPVARTSSEEPTPREGVYRHALAAARRAGIDPDHTYVLSTDVGVLVYRGTDSPVIQRTTALNETAEFIQPFVSLRLPTDAEGRVKFELVDETGTRRFVHEEFYRLHGGSNLLTPPSRLRVSDLGASESTWRLRVYAENMLVAEHEIEWEVASTSVVRRHLMEDGEISSEGVAEMRSLIEEQKLTSMSLDDLLAYQDDDPASKQARS